MKFVEYPDRSEFEETCKYSMMDSAEALQTPKDFPYPLILYLKDKVVLMWAKTNIERSFWVDTMNEMITETNPGKLENKEEFLQKLFKIDRSLGAQLAWKIKKHFFEKR